MTIQGFPYLNDTREVLEMKAEMRAELLATISEVLKRSDYLTPRPVEPMLTYEEWKVRMDRSMHPTPSDKAAEMLNGRNADALRGSERRSSGVFDSYWSGTLEWLEIRRSVKNVKREAPAYAGPVLARHLRISV